MQIYTTCYMYITAVFLPVTNILFSFKLQIQQLLPNAANLDRKIVLSNHLHKNVLWIPSEEKQEHSTCPIAVQE